jgi:hypothetical protein
VQIEELFDSATGFVALGALLGLLLLLPLWVSQRRDVRRMRAWMESEPDHPAEDLAASEAILDRAEAELEELMAEEPPAAEPAAEPAPTPATPMAAATRVTHERPALERITMERAALEPHPRWRRFASRATQPRVLVAIGLLALLLGGATILISEEVLKLGDDRPERTEAVVRSEVTVAVLNGTSVNGLAGKVSSEVEASGYRPGRISSTEPGFAQTVVLYAEGQKRAARKVARDLGVDKAMVEPLDRDSRRLAGDADVVVIAGEDRAS